MDELGQKLGVKDWKDWYRIKSDDIMNHGGVCYLIFYTNNKKAGVLNNYKHSLFSALKALYPEHDWQKKYFYSNFRYISQLH